MAKRGRRSYRRSSGGKSNLWGTALGVGGFILYEAAISPRIPLNGYAKNAAELALGAWASKKGGIIGNVGKAAVVLNLYQLMSPMLGNLTGLSVSSSSPSITYHS